MADPLDYDKALLDPAAVFDTPEAVLEHPELSRDQKVELLRRWEYDASEVAVAEEEGMLGEKPLLLRRVVLALERLTGDGSSHRGATKQNGG